MIVAVNGTATEIPDEATVAAVLTQLKVAAAGRGVAVAVQGEVVPRAEWVTMTLRDGDHIEIVAAIQGG